MAPKFEFFGAPDVVCTPSAGMSGVAGNWAKSLEDALAALDLNSAYVKGTEFDCSTLA